MARESWTTRKGARNSTNALGSVNPSATSPSVMMLIAAACRRWVVSTALAGPLFRLTSSSSNSIRKLVSSSSIALASAPGPRALALKCLHRRQQVPGRQSGSLGENAPNYPGERLLGVTLFPDQQLVGIDFDGDGLGSHTQIMHGPCMGSRRCVHAECEPGMGSNVYGEETAARGFSVASVSTSTAAMRKNPAPAVNAMAGPSPAAPPNPRSLTNATEVGPSPAPSATFRKKLTAIAKPRCRFGTTSSIEEKP